MTTYRSKALLLTLAIAGSVLAGRAFAAEGPAPGTVVPEEDMPMFCQKAAAARFDADLTGITTNTPIQRDGNYIVIGTVPGEDYNPGFECRFDANRAFLNVIPDPAASE